MRLYKFKITDSLILWISFLMANVNSDELLLVQVVWRHGDRTPMGTYPNDPNQKTAWSQGWGALTVKGMEQQVNLGKLLREEYIEKLQFLSSGYKSNEIYIRSTDVNRTLRSAISNLIGMYYNISTGKPGIDYPTTANWPRGYVPIPVHTVRRSTDYIGNPLCYCPRRDWLWKETEKTPEYQNLNQKSQKLLKKLTEICGQRITLDNLWMIEQVTTIEKDYNMTTIIDNLLYKEMKEINQKIANIEDGLDIQTYKGINFLVETAKIRGGSLLWAILNRIDHKISCQNNQNCTNCRWINTLKYYAYSAHDNTITALLTTLGAKTKLIRYGLPGYAAAVIIELWKQNANDYFLKFRFHRFQSGRLENFTNKTNGCEQYDNMCPYLIVRQKAAAFYPGNPAKLCQDVTSKWTYFQVPEQGNLNSQHFPENEELDETTNLPWRMHQFSSSNRCYSSMRSLSLPVIFLILTSVSLHA